MAKRAWVASTANGDRLKICSRRGSQVRILARWRRERGPIVDAFDRDGDLIDIGCANGYLPECLVEWGEERGRALVPYGVDFSEGLIKLARRRMPQHATHFWFANAWYSTPPRRFRFGYALLDWVPDALMGEYARPLLDRFAEPGGRLIAGHCGSPSRRHPPIDVAALLEANGLKIAGRSEGGDPVITRFAWVDKVCARTRGSHGQRRTPDPFPLLLMRSSVS